MKIDDLKDLPFPLLSLEEQEKIKQTMLEARTVHEKIDQMKSEIQSLKNKHWSVK